MTELEIMRQRHSVRQYDDMPIEQDKRTVLNELAEKLNTDAGVHIQIIYDEPKCFDSFMAHYGKFSGVQNYIALIGKKSADLDEKAGYYGERIVLKAQSLGLNTCWVAMTMSKGTVKKNCAIGPGEKLVCVIPVGYGTTQGVPHKSKAMDDLCRAAQRPEWFVNGMEAAMLAPTAMNQQKFLFTLDGNQVTAKATGGFYSKVDLGIVKYHFEVGAGKDHVTW